MIKTIKVTKEDIRYGHPRSAYTCPVARAMARELGTGNANLSVSPGSTTPSSNLGWRVHDYRHEKYYYLPLSVSRTIERYDSTGKMEPFEFHLDVTDYTTKNPQPK